MSNPIFVTFVFFVLFVVEKSGFQLDSQHTIFVVKNNPDRKAPAGATPLKKRSRASQEQKRAPWRPARSLPSEALGRGVGNLIGLHPAFRKPLGSATFRHPTAPEAWGSDNLASASADRRSTHTDSLFGCGLRTLTLRLYFIRATRPDAFRRVPRWRRRLLLPSR